MFQLVTFELIGEDWEEVSCGYYRTRKDADKAIPKYDDVCPLILVAPNGDGTVIRE